MDRQRTRSRHDGGTMARSRSGRVRDRAWDIVLEQRWFLLSGWVLLVAAVQFLTTPRWLGSWHYIVTGVGVLTGPHPLELYATHPELQMGPVTFVLSAPFVLLGGPLGLAGAAIAMDVIGLLVLREARALLRPGDAAGERRWFLTSLVVALGWNVLAVRYGHPDDVLALFAAVLALRMLRSDAVLRSALLLAISIDCKPWIAPLAFVLLAAPKRRWVPAAVIVIVVVAVAWLPFVFSAGTIRATSFTIVVDPTASIRLLGLATANTPVWCRPAQMLIGSVLVAVVARRHRWSAALLVVVVVRLLLDPATHTYYDAGLLVAACVFDIGAAIPVATLVALLGVHLPPVLHVTTPMQAIVRLAALGLLLGLSLVTRRRSRADLLASPHRDEITGSEYSQRHSERSDETGVLPVSSATSPFALR
jgi:hypothetical protein